MSKIEHTRGMVTLARTGAGMNTQWTFTVKGQTSQSSQTLIVNSVSTIEDLKALIGQVEHAAKVLALDEE